MKYSTWILLTIVLAGLVAGCGGASNATSTGQDALTQTPQPNTGAGDYASGVLSESYEGALPASSQLALGILKLEDRERHIV